MIDLSELIHVFKEARWDATFGLIAAIGQELWHALISGEPVAVIGAIVIGTVILYKGWRIIAKIFLRANI